MTSTAHDRRSDQAADHAADRVVVAKVRKLLAMAERTANPDEADAFSQKAAELIARHRIEPQRLRSLSIDDLGILEIEIGRGAYTRGRLALLHGVADAHGCRTVFEVRERGTVALVAGHRPDLDSVELLYHSLHTQASARMAGVRRQTAAATQQWRRSFLFGFAEQIRSALTQAAAEAREQLHPSNATLPVLRANDRRVDDFVKQKFGRVVSARRPKPATPTGWAAGRRAAKRADLGRRRVIGLRALEQGA